MLGLQHKFPVRVCVKAASLHNSLLFVFLFLEQIILETALLVLPSPEV